MENTVEWFEGRRNELIGLLDEATALQIPAEYAGELNAVAKKCRENAFEVALVGEFAGGKSTTFDALCDGRDISPRGLGGGGIKTSAAAVSVQNISDGETKDGLTEWAEITFRSSEALKLGMSSFLGRQCATDRGFLQTVGVVENFDFMKDVNLDDAAHREALLKVVDDLWGKWQENKKGWEDKDLDQLRIATLQLRNYKTKAYRAMVARPVLPVTEFQKLVAFPKDWSTRWTNGRDAVFSFEESAFAFIESVLVRLCSRNLARLGCRVTDCPGLFANAYDTSVAQRVISGADCVWYLIDGDKVIGQKDKDSIRQIHQMGMADKIVASCNLRGDHEQKLAEVVPATRTEIANAGFDLDVLPYNARLAFLSMQGELALNHPEALSEIDRANMRTDAKVKSGDPDLETMWTKMIGRMGGTTGLEELEAINTLDDDALKLVRKASYLDEIIDHFAKDAVSKKARSLLIDKGAARAVEALRKYEGNLQVAEDAAAADVEACRGKLAAAQQELDAFIENAQAVVEKSILNQNADLLARELAGKFVRQVLSSDFRQDLALCISRVIAKHEGEFAWNREDFMRKVMADVRPVAYGCFNTSVSRVIEAFRKGGESTGITRLKNACRQLSDDIHGLWKDRRLDENVFFEGFPIPEVPQNIAEVISDEIVTGSFGGTILQDAVEEARLGIFGVLWDALKGLAGLVPLLWDILIAVFSKRSKVDAEPDERRWERVACEQFFPKVLPSVESAFQNLTTIENIEKPLVGKFVGALAKIVRDYEKALFWLSQDFEQSRCKPVEESFSKSQLERRQIAESNHRIRKMKIEPLRKRLEKFANDVVSELST